MECFIDMDIFGGACDGAGACGSGAFAAAGACAFGACAIFERRTCNLGALSTCGHLKSSKKCLEIRKSNMTLGALAERAHRVWINRHKNRILVFAVQPVLGG